MIAVTSNSLISNSTLPPLPNAIACEFLEEMTGADVMLSVAEYPVRTRPLLKRHLESGAILVQHKHGLDLLASFGERLDSEIARMCESAPRQAQRVLLTIGTFYRRGKELYLDGVPTGMEWLQYQGAISKWRGRGGCVENLPTSSYIPDWCEMQLKHLREYRNAPVKQVYARARMPDDAPVEGDPLQLCVRVDDGRNVLIAIPGVGPRLVEWLWEQTGGNLAWCLRLLTHESDYRLFEERPRNLGPALIEKCRALFIDEIPF